MSEWKRLNPPAENILLNCSLLSNVEHGLKTKAFPSSKSIYYDSPYFIIFKSPYLTSNYLNFNNFYKPNSENCVLAMVLYNEDENNFVPYFSPGVTLSFLQNLSLEKTLEFVIVDSNQQIISIADNSQLFIQLTISN